MDKLYLVSLAWNYQNTHGFYNVTVDRINPSVIIEDVQQQLAEQIPAHQGPVKPEEVNVIILFFGEITE